MVNLMHIRGEAMDLLDTFRDIIFLTFLTTQFLHLGIGQEVFLIKRQPTVDSSVWALDYFKPFLQCSGSRPRPNCAAYKGYVVFGKCPCQCTFQKATFGFYSRMWTCLDNIEVRNQTGCKYKFVFEYDRYPLKIVQQDRKYNIILPSKNCSVESKTTRYFTCDGRWAGIDSMSWFTIIYESSRKLHNSISHKYQLMIGSDVDDELLGRIIRLNINCANHTNSCLLFKLEGTMYCDENVTSATTAKPSPTRKVSDKIPTTATAKATSTGTASSIATATPVPNATANLKDNGQKGKAKASGSSSTLVGVVVTLVIIVVIVIAIVAYVYRKRKRGESVWLVDYISSRVRKSRSAKPKKKTVDETQEDQEYAEVTEEQRRNVPVDQAGDIYSYAFDDPQTAYIAPQPAPYNRLVHNQNRADQEGTIYSTANDGSVYNVLERPPAENHFMMTSERTINEGPFSQDLEPKYHVLEGPDTTMNEGPPLQDLEPEYHVLEGRDITDETTDSPLNGNTDVRAWIGTANPSGPQTHHVAPKERRKPPSPPRKI